jgi:hypothetical protein
MKNSEIFWNSILIILLIICGIYDYRLLILLLFMGSVLFCGIFVPKMILFPKTKYSFWMYLLPIVWLFYITTFVTFLTKYIYKKVIIPFNNKLDNK